MKTIMSMDGRFVGPVLGPDFRSEILSGPIRGPEFGPDLYLVRSVVRILVWIFLGPTIRTGPEFRYNPAVRDNESYSSKYSFKPYD